MKQRGSMKKNICEKSNKLDLLEDFCKKKRSDSVPDCERENEAVIVGGRLVLTTNPITNLHRYEVPSLLSSCTKKVYRLCDNNLSFQAIMSTRQLYKNLDLPNEISSRIRNIQEDYRLCCGGMMVMSKEKGLSFGFLLTNTAVFVYYQRSNRCKGEDSASFTSTVLVSTRDVCKEYTEEDFVNLSILFEPCSHRVTWILDGEEVYTLGNVGHRLADEYQVRDLGGKADKTYPTDLTLEFGNYSFYDHQLPHNYSRDMVTNECVNDVIVPRSNSGLVRLGRKYKEVLPDVYGVRRDAGSNAFAMCTPCSFKQGVVTAIHSAAITEFCIKGRETSTCRKKCKRVNRICSESNHIYNRSCCSTIADFGNVVDSNNTTTDSNNTTTNSNNTTTDSNNVVDSNNTTTDSNNVADSNNVVDSNNVTDSSNTTTDSNNVVDSSNTTTDSNNVVDSSNTILSSINNRNVDNSRGDTTNSFDNSRGDTTNSFDNSSSLLHNDNSNVSNNVNNDNSNVSNNVNNDNSNVSNSSSIAHTNKSDDDNTNTTVDNSHGNTITDNSNHSVKGDTGDIITNDNSTKNRDVINNDNSLKGDTTDSSIRGNSVDNNNVTNEGSGGNINITGEGNNGGNNGNITITGDVRINYIKCHRRSKSESDTSLCDDDIPIYNMSSKIRKMVSGRNYKSDINTNRIIENSCYSSDEESCNSIDGVTREECSLTTIDEESCNSMDGVSREEGSLIAIDEESDSDHECIVTLEGSCSSIPDHVNGCTRDEDDLVTIEEYVDDLVTMSDCEYTLEEI